MQPSDSTSRSPGGTGHSDGAEQGMSLETMATARGQQGTRQSPVQGGLLTCTCQAKEGGPQGKLLPPH